MRCDRVLRLLFKRSRRDDRAIKDVVHEITVVARRLPLTECEDVNERQNKRDEGDSKRGGDVPLKDGKEDE